jgi:putative sigma-54 modulation protein
MNHNIYGNKLKITKAIKEYINKKLSKLDKYFENPELINSKVLVRISGHDQIVEVTISIGKVILRAEERHSDLYAAIDLVADKLERQIRKNKEKILSKMMKDGNDLNKYPFMEEQEISVVKRKKLDMKPMDEEEAILQMNLLDHDFFVFRDIETNGICILYRRKDGNYGIIET